jgi:23S rRNA pseudouridine1911/1915/1917 synthase
LPRGASDELRTLLQGFRRQALHASRLAFTHPASGSAVSFTSPLAADFEQLLAALRADAAVAR